MGNQLIGLTTGEPMPGMMITPNTVDATAVLGLLFSQVIIASLLGALLQGRTYAWSWSSGGDGITLSGAGTPIVTITSLSLTPVVRSGMLQVKISGPTMFTRTVEIPVTIRHQL